MLDITLSNFEPDVLEASRRQPVLLDIWAPWCAPCKALGPVLEKLETAYAGRFALAKLNSDEQPEIAGQLSQMFGVRSIPFCVLFHEGQPVDGFVGALPERELRAFLDKHVPGVPALDGSQDADRVRELLSAGQLDEAIATMQLSLADDPGNDELRFACLRALIQTGRLDEAKQVYAPVAGRGSPATDDLAACGVWLEACEDFRTNLPMSTDADAPQGPMQARDQDARYRCAMAHLAASRFTDALDGLLEILMREKGWGNGRARTSFLAILRLLRAAEVSSPAPDSSRAATATELLTSGSASRKVLSTSDAYHRRLSMVIF